MTSNGGRSGVNKRRLHTIAKAFDYEGCGEGINEAYLVAGVIGFGWWLVEHYLSYHVNCPDGCGLGEPARGR